MNQQPNSDQNSNIGDSLFSEAQVAQAGGNLSQIQNINAYSILNLAGAFRPRQINSSNQQDSNFRKILLNRVKQYWIKDLLEKSLHSKALIELGLEERLDAVERPSEIAQENSRDLRQSLPEDKNNIDVFREMDEGRSLLILGQPGAGKTTFMLRIVKSLIADTEENLSLPIPVVFNLSSWANKRQSIAQWLIQELIKYYKVSKYLAKHWIQNQQLLLMLDGLDEVKAEYRNTCVNVLNEFMQSYGETEIVVCSRVKDYESLSNRLAIQRGVCIQSLTTEQINDYLDRAGNQLQAVKTLLETDTALQELVKSPLMLSIITLAYKGVAIEDLPKFDSVEEHRQHLFNSYIQGMFERRGTNKVYPEDKARNWLSCLAYKMSQDSQTIFSLEQIQPRWLETVWQKLIYNIGVILFSSLIISIIGVFLPKLYFIIFLKQTLTYQKIYNNFLFFFRLGLFLATVTLINLWLNNKKEIILPALSLKWSRKKAFKGIVFWSKTGLLLGFCFGLFFTNYFVSRGKINILNEKFNVFNNIFLGLMASLLLGILFVLLFKLIKKIFSSTLITLKIRLLSILIFTIKNIIIILRQGIFVGFFIWIFSLIFEKLTFPVISLALIFLFFSFIFGFITSCLFGIIGAVVGDQDAVDIQKEVVSVNPVKKALVNSIIWTLTVGLISGLIIGGCFFLSGNFSILKENSYNSIALTFVLTIFLGQVVSFACIQHFALRFTLYRYKYIAWNYTHFLEYATERIFLQKVGAGYIFVHRLLLEHFAALYQPSQLSLNTRLNLPITRKYKLFSIVTTILIMFLGYQFRKEVQISVYTQLIKIYPKNTYAYNNRGFAYSQIKDYDRAIADYTKAIKIDPKYTYAYNNRGLAYSQIKDYNYAIADYTKAINIDSEYTDAYYNRGYAYSQIKDYNHAIADYNKLIKLDPEDTYAYYNRGLAYYLKRQYNRAITNYNKAIELDPKYTLAYYNRGLAYYLNEDYDRAIADYTQVINIDPKYTYAYYNRGSVYKNQGSKDKAIEDFKKVLELNKDRDLSQKASKQLQELSTF